MSQVSSLPAQLRNRQRWFKLMRCCSSCASVAGNTELAASSAEYPFAAALATSFRKMTSAPLEPPAKHQGVGSRGRSTSSLPK